MKALTIGEQIIMVSANWRVARDGRGGLAHLRVLPCVPRAGQACQGAAHRRAWRSSLAVTGRLGRMAGVRV